MLLDIESCVVDESWGYFPTPSTMAIYQTLTMIHLGLGVAAAPWTADGETIPLAGELSNVSMVGYFSRAFRSSLMAVKASNPPITNKASKLYISKHRAVVSMSSLGKPRFVPISEPPLFASPSTSSQVISRTEPSGLSLWCL